MYYKKAILASLILLFITITGFVSSIPGVAKNLKVLPQDISEDKLDSFMHSYNKALDVSCDFCHAKNKEGDLDFASDENPAKEVARNMIRLTIDINKKYFNTDSTIHPAYLNIVKCYTCHKGNAYPQ
ncbi:MAG: c-type cytochrome [Niabella sp.]